MYTLAIFLDFGPLGPIILLAILAVLAGLVFFVGVVVGAVITLLFLRRRKAVGTTQGQRASPGEHTSQAGENECQQASPNSSGHHQPFSFAELACCLRPVGITAIGRLDVFSTTQELS